MQPDLIPAAENWISTAGPAVASRPAGRVRLVVYPGEFTTVTGVTLGHIYVVNGDREKYEIAGGLPPDPKRGRGADGHFADATRPSHRDEMMKKGYLKAGMEIEVKPYGQKGPP